MKVHSLDPITNTSNQTQLISIKRHFWSNVEKDIAILKAFRGKMRQNKNKKL